MFVSVITKTLNRETLHTMSKVGGWGILRNGGDLSNGG